MNPIERLRSVLCDPEGKCCIHGSDEDRRIVDEALRDMAEKWRAHREAGQSEPLTITVWKDGSYLSQKPFDDIEVRNSDPDWLCSIPLVKGFVAAPTGDTVQVPREPTEAMTEAGDLFFTNQSFISVSPAQINAIYRAMLAAAQGGPVAMPKPPYDPDYLLEVAENTLIPVDEKKKAALFAVCDLFSKPDGYVKPPQVDHGGQSAEAQAAPSAIAATDEEREAVIACLGDDAVKLFDANPFDEMAENMQKAAAMLAAAPAPAQETGPCACDDGGSKCKYLNGSPLCDQPAPAPGAEAPRVEVAATWQPIETAPKDGKDYLFYKKGHISEARWLGEGKGFGGNGWSYDLEANIANGRNEQPTHWMPLPEAPSGFRMKGGEQRG